MTQFHNAEHEKLAKQAIDPKRLLIGENPQSRHPEDSAHWIRVYRELAGFKERMLAEMELGLPDLHAVAESEVKTIDMGIIQQQLDRYRHRLAFWEQRDRELDSERRRLPAEGVSANLSS